MKHELKILPEFFESIVNWRKKAEFRKNDKNYRVNDILVLREYIPDNMGVDIPNSVLTCRN